MALGPEYDAKTMSELQAEFVQLGNDLSVCAQKRNDVLALMEKRKAEAKAAASVAQLDALEREALKKALEARQQP